MKTVLLLLPGLMLPVARAAEIRLAEGGVARAEIVLATNAFRSAQFAAYELKAHLDAITGADFAIVTPGARTDGRLPIFVGPDACGADVGDLAEEEGVVDISQERILLYGFDAPVRMTSPVVYDGGVTRFRQLPKDIPDKWEARGTLNATYGFLRDACGVEWVDPTEFGACLPSAPALAVQSGVTRSAPFVRARNMPIAPEEWDENRSKEGWRGWLCRAYPHAMARDPHWGAMRQAKHVFWLRMRLGGDGHRAANHSFYWCYDRYWKTNSAHFAEFRPDLFSRHKDRKDGQGTAQDGIFSAYDLKKLPGQMCYSNEDFIRLVIADARAYFDAGGYTNRWQNRKASPEHPVPFWGRDVYCVEPMDNRAFCECPSCAAQYDLRRKDESAVYTDYWFRFVNRIARAVKASHPGKKVSTLAYGTGREGVPTFPLEDNVIVHFCWSANRCPGDAKVFARQKRLLADWHAKYPHNSFGMWLYNGFPHESGTWFNYLPFPGFFGDLCAEEMKYLKANNVTDTVFCCGQKDDFESYLVARLLWNPDEGYANLKDRFFRSFGPAEKPIRRFYDLVETRYVTNAVSRVHMTREDAWGVLGTKDFLDELSVCLDAADRAVAGSSEFHRRRVANWRYAYYDYMLEARRRREPMKCATPGVKAFRTEYIGQSVPEPFGDPDVLKGRSFSITNPDGSPAKLGFVGGQFRDQWKDSLHVTALTSDTGFSGFLVGGDVTGVVYRCDVPLRRLRRFRLMTGFGPHRKRFFFDLVGWKDGRCVTLVKDYLSNDWSVIRPGVKGCVTHEFVFDPSTVPENLEAIGLVDNYARQPKFWSPHYIRFEAAADIPQEASFRNPPARALYTP